MAERNPVRVARLDDYAQRPEIIHEMGHKPPRTLTMFPFVPEELGARFKLEHALSHGTLPLVHGSEEPDETLKAYVLTYLKEEIQAEAVARNLAGFARFLPIAGLMHGQTLNASSLARDSGVARPDPTRIEGKVRDSERIATFVD